jgi:tol-pal system protein YbgF
MGTPKEQYDFAYKLVRQGDYARAEVAFREFGELHPSDPLAGNAKYWLGETFYVREDFVQAADAFIGVVTGYPDSPKRPHSMLKLGMSLLALGQKQEGCATLGELLENDGQDAAATRARAESERQRAGCT